MARPKKAEASDVVYTVTAGNVVYDIHGNRKLEGDEIELPEDAVEALKNTGVIK